MSIYQIRKEWTSEEEMTLLELVTENGRKWSLISKKLIGRNEHTVKNRYISILRFLKKKGIVVNPNNFQEVLDAFRKVKDDSHPIKIESFSVPAESRKIISKTSKNLEEKEEISCINVKKEMALENPNLHKKIKENLDNQLQKNNGSKSNDQIPAAMDIENNFLGFSNLSGMNPNQFLNDNFFYEQYLKSSLFFRDQIFMEMLADITFQNHLNPFLYSNANES